MPRKLFLHLNIVSSTETAHKHDRTSHAVKETQQVQQGRLYSTNMHHKAIVLYTLYSKGGQERINTFDCVLLTRVVMYTSYLSSGVNL